VGKNRTAEHDAVLKTVRLYIDGTFTGHVETYKQAFHEKAIISGRIHPPNSAPEGVLMVAPIQAIFPLMEAGPSPKAQGAPYEARIEAIDIAGDTAHALVYEESLNGHDYVNHLNLHKDAGRWLIVSKAFRAEDA
jgi:hypothetical protein